MFPSDYESKLIQHLGAGNILRYYPFSEGSGTTVNDRGKLKRNGTYSGVTLAGDISPDGRPVPSYDGINDLANCDTSVTADIGSLQKGSIGISLFVDAATWIDGVFRYAMFLLEVTNTDYALFFKRLANNSIRFGLRLNNVIYDYDYFPTAAERAAWFQVIMSWDTAGDQKVRYFFNGDQKQETALTEVWTMDADALRFSSNVGEAVGFHKGQQAHAFITNTQLLEADAEYLAREARIIT